VLRVLNETGKGGYSPGGEREEYVDDQADLAGTSCRGQQGPRALPRKGKESRASTRGSRGTVFKSRR